MPLESVVDNAIAKLEQEIAQYATEDVPGHLVNQLAYFRLIQNLPALTNGRLPVDIGDGAVGGDSSGTPVTGVTLGSGGSGSIGWLSAIWKLISDRLPILQIDNSGRLKVTAESSVPDEIDIPETNSGGTIVPPTDVSAYNYLSIEIEVLNNFRGVLNIRSSTAGNFYVFPRLDVYSSNPSEIAPEVFNSAITYDSNNYGYRIYHCPVNFKYLNINLSGVTAGSIKGKILLYKSNKQPLAFRRQIVEGYTLEGEAFTPFRNKPVMIGGKAYDVPAWAVESGDIGITLLDRHGKIVTFPFAPSGAARRTLKQLVDDAPIQLIDLSGLGLRTAISTLILTNLGAIASEVIVSTSTSSNFDANAVASFFVPPYDTVVANFTYPIISVTASGFGIRAVEPAVNIKVTLIGFSCI